MRPSGVQLLAEFVDCRGALLDAENIEKIVRRCLKRNGISLKYITSYKFLPIGVTSVAVIGKSHIAIHTYPEAKHLSIDIFMCAARHEAVRLFRSLKIAFGPKVVRMLELTRGDPLAVKDKNVLISPSAHGFETRYHIKKLIFTKQSQYQKIDIIENESFGKMLFLDNELQIAERDADIYNKAMIASLLIRKNSLGRIAILGGGDGGVLAEAYIHNPKEAVLVDIDKDVVDASMKYLPKIHKNVFRKRNVTLVFDDARNFLTQHQRFDTMVYDLTTHPEAFTLMDRTTYLDNMFLLVKQSLKPRGVISMQCCSKFDRSALKYIESTLLCHFRHISFQEVFIPSFCEPWIFVSADNSQR